MGYSITKVEFVEISPSPGEFAVRLEECLGLEVAIRSLAPTSSTSFCLSIPALNESIDCHRAERALTIDLNGSSSYLRRAIEEVLVRSPGVVESTLIQQLRGRKPFKRQAVPRPWRLRLPKVAQLALSVLFLPISLFVELVIVLPFALWRRLNTPDK